jgi:hypothetical protein
MVMSLGLGLSDESYQTNNSIQSSISAILFLTLSPHKVTTCKIFLKVRDVYCWRYRYVFGNG